MLSDGAEPHTALGAHRTDRASWWSRFPWGPATGQGPAGRGALETLRAREAAGKGGDLDRLLQEQPSLEPLGREPHSVSV